MFPAEAVRADLEHLYSTLQQSHSDLFIHTPRDVYDQRYREVSEAIDRPMSRLDVVRLFMPFVALGNVGHANIAFPVQDYIAYAQAEGTLIPLDIVVQDGRTFVAHDYSGSSVVQPGAELVSINGRAIGDWVERLSRYTSAERPYMDHAQLESMFPRMFWLDQGKVDSFQITVRTLGGSDTTITVPAVSVMEVERRKGTQEKAFHERKAAILPGGIAYLRPGPFYATRQDETVADFKTFVDGAFREFMEAGAQDLILDLRNNPGGDNEFSDPIIAWFADRPFRFASRFMLRVSPETRRSAQEYAAQDPDGISAQMLHQMSGRTDGERFAFELPYAHPREDSRFTGRVYALVNRHSYSNAAVVAAIIQDYSFGVAIGEETADLPTTHASSVQFALPNTGVVVTYPKAYFIRPSGDETFRGVVPDYTIEHPIATGDEDLVLHRALTLIRSNAPR
jgi:hypothetical protein